MTDRKPTIDDQIAAVRHLVDEETNRIEFRISRGKLRADTGNWQLDVLSAACATLAFVRQYADGFRDFIEAQRAFERDRAAELASAQKTATDMQEAT